MSIVLTHKGSDPADLTGLIRRAKSTNPSINQPAKAQLVELYREVVENQAKGYIRRGKAAKGLAIPQTIIYSMKFDEDIVSAAWEGFFRALDIYDPDRGVPFRSFFMYHILHRCTCEFGTYVSPVSGTYSSLWRRFMRWCKNNPQTNQKKWADIVRIASKDLKVQPSEIQDILSARGFVASEEQEKSIATAAVDHEMSNATAMDIVVDTMKAAGSRSYLPTRTEVARELIRRTGGDGDPEEVVCTREFKSLYRQHVTSSSDSSVRRSRIQARAAKNSKRRITTTYQ